MSELMDLQIDAFDPAGRSSRATLLPTSRAVKRFALTAANEETRSLSSLMAPGPEASLSDWQHPAVGWGLVVNEADPLPKCVRELVKEREAHVFLYMPRSDRSLTFLRNERLGRDVSVTGSARGMGPGRLPHYLMILGGPERVPWRLQFSLAATRAVGRVPLDGQALENYIAAVRSGFAASRADPYTTVTWSVDLGRSDITHLMRTHIAHAVQQQFLDDEEMGPGRTCFLDGLATPGLASAERLVDALKQRRPGLVVTTSHGQAGPANDLARMRETIGLPVDQLGQALAPSALLQEWSPDGAIWYCHACCSAGVDAPSFFAPLFDEQTDLRETLDALSACDAMVAPLPLALLGHERPARGFVGHVEPTFDWTLRNPFNRQVLTGKIVEALYAKLYQPAPRTPLGQAFRDVHADIGGYLAAWDIERARYDAGTDNLDTLLDLQLCARDLQSLVVLGDPACCLALNGRPT